MLARFCLCQRSRARKTLLGMGYLDQLGWYNVTLMDIDTIIDRRLFVPHRGAAGGDDGGWWRQCSCSMFKNGRCSIGIGKCSKACGARGRARAITRPALGYRRDGARTRSGAIVDSALCRTWHVQVDGHTREPRSAGARADAQELEQPGVPRRTDRACSIAAASPPPMPTSRAIGSEYGLLLVDVDHFKSDQRHPWPCGSGDIVVAEVSRRIGEACLGPTRGLLRRWGGDEFIVLLPESSPNLLRATAYAVMASISREPILSTEGRAIEVSVSIGACLAEAGDRMETATEMADTALYMAKARGRNKVVVFEAEMHHATKRIGV
jgi:diguanylate cyclase (GGDEF)-like protein